MKATFLYQEPDLQLIIYFHHILYKINRSHLPFNFLYQKPAAPKIQRCHPHVEERCYLAAALLHETRIKFILNSPLKLWSLWGCS